MKPFQLGLPLLLGFYAACGGTEDGGTDNTAGATSKAGSTSTAGTTTGTSGSGNGTAGSSNGTAGTGNGTAGTSNGSSGSATGGQNQGTGGTANPAACPATQPEDDGACTPMAATGGTNGGNNLACTYGTERCTCRPDFGGPGQGDGGGDAEPAEGSWRCRMVQSQGGNNTGGFSFGGRNGGGGTGGTAPNGDGGAN